MCDTLLISFQCNRHNVCMMVFEFQSITHSVLCSCDAHHISTSMESLLDSKSPLHSFVYFSNALSLHYLFSLPALVKKFHTVAELVDDVPHLLQWIWMVIVLFLQMQEALFDY